MNRQLLDQPFAPEEIKQRVGNHGTMLDYVEVHLVVERLNSAFEGQWSFSVVSYDIDEAHDEVRVLGKLTAENVVKMQFGSSQITRHKQTKEPVCLGDDLKSACSNSLKKAASWLGVGLHLSKGKDEARTQSPPSPDPVHAPTNTNQASTTQQTSGRLSQKQFGYIQNLARENGMTKRELDLHCQTKFGGVVLAHITKNDASQLISEFNNPERTPLPQPQQPDRHTPGGVH